MELNNINHKDVYYKSRCSFFTKPKTFIFSTAFIIVTLLLSNFISTSVLFEGIPDFRLSLSGGEIEEDPYLIYDVNDLQAMRDDLSAHYALANDIDASETRDWDGGFEPIGDENIQFRGRFDGGNHVITNLYINRGETNFVGLFGSVGTEGTVSNVSLLDATVIGNNNVGGLIGFNNGEYVSDSHVMGDVTGSMYVGGLLGYNYGGTVSNSFSLGDVDGDSRVGGLIGLNTGVIHRSYSIGNVNGDENRIGGLLGFNAGEVTKSYATGNVTGETYVGGLVGYNCFALISESYSATNVSRGSTAGGLVGWNDGTVRNSYATGDVNGNRNVGGLVGTNAIGLIEKSYAVGAVNGLEDVGGLLGTNIHGGTVEKSFWNTHTSGQTTSQGGIGLGPSQMRDVQTYIDAGWNITMVTSIDQHHGDYTWNIVQNETYPFLSFRDEMEPRVSGIDLPLFWVIFIFLMGVLLLMVFTSVIRGNNKF